MKLLHTSDWHVTEGRRFDEAVSVLREIVEHGIRVGVDAWFVAGDFFGTSVPYRSTPRERVAVADLFVSMAEHAPVFGVYGNHCFPEDLDLFSRLKAQHPIVVASRPMVVQVNDLRVYLLPYPSKRFFMAQKVEVDISGQKVAMEGGLRAILDAWRLDAQEARSLGQFTVGAMHINVAGSATAGGEVLVGQEVELSRHDLDALGLDYIALGHLHLQQQVADRAFYSGSPYGQNFGEPDRKAFLLVELGSEPGSEPIVQRIPTSARPMVTVRMEWGLLDGQWSVVGEEVPSDLQGAEVRLIVQLPEDGVETCPFEKLEQDLVGMGAHSVKVERRILPKVRIRSEAITKAVTLEDQLNAYFDSLQDPPPEEQRSRVLSKLSELHSEPIEQEAAA